MLIHRVRAKLCGLTAEMVIPELTVHWQESYYSTSEADGSVEVCAELSTLQFDGNVEVNYATISGSAEGVCIYVSVFVLAWALSPLVAAS